MIPAVHTPTRTGRSLETDGLDVACRLSLIISNPIRWPPQLGHRLSVDSSAFLPRVEPPGGPFRPARRSVSIRTLSQNFGYCNNLRLTVEFGQPAGDGDPCKRGQCCPRSDPYLGMHLWRGRSALQGWRERPVVSDVSER